MIMPALYVRSPWANLIASGTKAIETRHYKPPDHVIGEWVAIVQPRCRGNPKARVRCLAYISGFYKYRDKQHWADELTSHRVNSCDPDFGWKEDKPKYAWKLQMVADINDTWYWKIISGGRVWTTVQVGFRHFLETTGGYGTCSELQSSQKTMRSLIPTSLQESCEV